MWPTRCGSFWITRKLVISQSKVTRAPGNTAILAIIVQRLGCIAHFNIRNKGVSGSINFSTTFVVKSSPALDCSIRACLRRRRKTVRSPAFLKEAADQLDVNESLVIAVDALDEADEPEHGENVLFLPGTLPPRCILSSRAGGRRCS